MSWLAKIQKWWGRGKRLSPLESAIVEAVAAKMPPATADLLRKQIAAITLVQRHFGGTEICTYCKRHGKVFRDPDIDFANKFRELKIALVKFNVHGHAETWRATLWATAGHFFSINFSPGSAQITDIADPRILSVELIADLEHAVDQPERAQADPSQVKLPSWLEGERRHIESVFAPLDERTKIVYLQQLSGLNLPHDYRELLDGCDGLSAHEIKVYGLAEIYSFPADGGMYFAAAEHPIRGILALKDGAEPDHIYRFELADPTPEVYGKSFSESLLRLIKEAKSLD